MKLPLYSLSIFFLIYSSLTFSENKTAPHGQPKLTPPPINGIAFPKGYQDWSVVSVSHREDNKTLRVIIGNPIAIDAIEKDLTNPWPDGTILGKMVWKDSKDEHWESAVVPSEFVHSEFMFKNTTKWKNTGGWGWARWLGTEQKPFGKGESASASCVACHTPVKKRDWVYTTPAVFPKRIK